MATVDDIDISGAASSRVVADLISSLLGIPVSCRADDTPYMRIDDRTQVTVYPDDDRPGCWIAEVYHAGTDEDQLALSHRIYGHLVEQTTWDLTLTSDRDPDYVVATRTRAHA